jgi:MOSC domain-containing protein YiiM
VKELFDVLPQTGRVVRIGIRPERRAEPVFVERVEALEAGGLQGDHYSGGSQGKRQVTLIQAEHIEAVASMLGVESVDAGRTRRNIVVRGINLLALHDRRFRIGGVVLEGTGYCHPCSRMEENLGPGGYNAMRGHGGIIARIVEGGEIRVGDSVGLVLGEHK